MATNQLKHYPAVARVNNKMINYWIGQNNRAGNERRSASTTKRSARIYRYVWGCI